MADGPQTPESAIGSCPSGPTQVEATNQQEQSPVPSLSDQSENKEIKLTNQVLVNFLEKQKYSTPEDQSLIPEQQEFNRKVDELIKSLNQKPDQPINQETFIQALNYGYERNLPEEISQIESLISQMQEEINNSSKTTEEKNEIKMKVQFLEEMLKRKQKLLREEAKIPEEVIKQIETVFSKLEEDTELKNQLLTHLNSGNFDGLMQAFVNKSLQEEAGDSEETKKEKSRARTAIEGLKKYGLPIGGVFAILLLLMIFKAGEGEGGQGQIM